MTKSFRILAAGALLAAAAPLVLAHHSAVQYDFTKPTEYKGTVKHFSAGNPHMRMTLDMKDPKGQGNIEVKFEGHSTNNMYRNGYRKGMVNVGDQISVIVAPLRDGTPGGYVLGATAANGEYFGARTTRALDAEALKKQAEGR